MKAEALLDFLRRNESDYLYLVGDIFDGWALGKTWYWPQAHNDVVQKVLRKARKGTRVMYIPGNHDEFARNFIDQQFGGIVTRLNATHTTADGRQYIVLHGDEFDGVVHYAQWLSVLGARAYQLTLSANYWYNRIRKWLNLPYWSLSGYLKYKTKRAVQHIANFEHVVAQEARKYEVDGVICGHIHHAEMRTIEGVHYCNTGDWVESCTALVEHVDGALEILHWVGPFETDEPPADEAPESEIDMRLPHAMNGILLH